MTPNETLDCRIYPERIIGVTTTLNRDKLRHAILTHEGGHGISIGHYRIGERERPGNQPESYMCYPMNALNVLPEGFDKVDVEQIRLHSNHE